MKKTLFFAILLWAICLPVQATVIFTENFDSTTWTPPSGSECGGTVNPCTGDTVPPTNWYAYRANAAPSGTGYVGPLPSSQVDHTLGTTSGHAFVARYGGTPNTSDNDISKYLGAEYPELWVSFWVRSSGQTSVTGAGEKLFRVLRLDTSCGNPNEFFSQGCGCPIFIYNFTGSTSGTGTWKGSFRCDPQASNYYCTTDYDTNDTQAWSPAGIGWKDTNYHKLKFRVVMNTGTSANGIAEVYIDGTQVLNRTNIQWRGTGYDATGWNYISLGGNTPEGTSPDEWQAIDDLIVATTEAEVDGGGPGPVPVITSFVVPATYDALTVPITTFTATDDVAVTGYFVKESSTPPLAGDAGWIATAQTSFTFGVDGVHTLYAWVKDGDGNISSSSYQTVTITFVTMAAYCASGDCCAGRPGCSSNTLTGAGVFTVPDGVTSLTVEGWGAGGKGSTRTTSGGGGGGGGGAYAKKANITVTPAEEIPFYVGAGSTSTAAGEDSTFDTNVVVAKGGQSVANNTATGAVGGLASASTGDTKYDGGRGYTYSTGTYGAGGGSSAGSALAGNVTTATNASSYNGAAAVFEGGPGGNGSTSTSSNASAPVSGPGGGGGGARRSTTGTRTGGNGFAGKVIISWPPPSDPIDTTPPVMSNLLPSGSQACTSNPLAINLQVSTDEPASCKWDETDGPYATMGHTFSTTDNTNHTASANFDCNTTHTVKVRCIDQATTPNVDTQSSLIQFSVAAQSASAIHSMQGGNASGGKVQ